MTAKFKPYKADLFNFRFSLSDNNFPKKILLNIFHHFKFWILFVEFLKVCGPGRAFRHAARVELCCSVQSNTWTDRFSSLWILNRMVDLQLDKIAEVDCFTTVLFVRFVLTSGGLHSYRYLQPVMWSFGYYISSEHNCFAKQINTNICWNEW